MSERRKPGRPQGDKFPEKKQFRLTVENAERLAALAKAWRVSESEVVRRLIGAAWEEWQRSELPARVAALESRLRATPPARAEGEEA